mgnify:CR=1 FL=1
MERILLLTTASLWKLIQFVIVTILPYSLVINWTAQAMQIWMTIPASEIHSRFAIGEDSNMSWIIYKIKTLQDWFLTCSYDLDWRACSDIITSGVVSKTDIHQNWIMAVQTCLYSRQGCLPISSNSWTSPRKPSLQSDSLRFRISLFSHVTTQCTHSQFL